MAAIAEPEDSTLSLGIEADNTAVLLLSQSNGFSESFPAEEEKSALSVSELPKKPNRLMTSISAKRKKFSLPLAAPRPLTRSIIPNKPSRKRMTICQCLQKTVVFFLSSVGITVMVVAYSIVGGLVFVALERPNEEIVQKKVSAVRQKYLYDLYDVFDQMNIFRQENWTAGADLVLRQFQKDIFEFVTKEGWGGEEVIGGDPKWTFASSLLYSVTVITTIGFGTITPKTVGGQVVTMIYALIGIPLTFVCLSNIGRYMAASFRTLYGRAWCVTCRRKWRIFLGRTHSRLNKMELHKNMRYHAQNPTENGTEEDDCEVNHIVEIPFTTCLMLVVWYIVFGAILFTIWETEWDLFTGAYFCFITLSTIGFGDIVPGLTHEDWSDEVKQVVCTLYLLIGLSTLAMCFELMQERGQNFAKRCATFLGLLNEEDETDV